MSEARTTHIQGLSPRESVGIIQTLVKHLDKSLDCHTRVHWEPNTVAIWDNRAVMHSAIWDYWPEKRVCRKVAMHGGERPYYDPGAGSQSEMYGNAEKGIMPPSWLRHSTYKSTLNQQDKPK